MFYIRCMFLYIYLFLKDLLLSTWELGGLGDPNKDQRTDLGVGSLTQAAEGHLS